MFHRGAFRLDMSPRGPELRVRSERLLDALFEVGFDDERREKCPAARGAQLLQEETDQDENRSQDDR